MDNVPDDTATLPPSGLGNPLSAPVAAAPPGYALLGELGRGGMGVVYRARQLALERTVALKMVLAGNHADAESLVRFRAEAAAIARVQHPNIVQIHEVGEHEGRPFFAMEYVAGGDFRAKLHGTPLPQREAAELVRTLAGALDVLHQHNIIHRDLKPANILLATDGTPKITDFGLAKQMDRDSGQTKSGAIVGTPSYMAPEQARGTSRTPSSQGGASQGARPGSHPSQGGERGGLGPATDIYALGAVLYEALTGRPPFQAATPLDTLLQVLECDAVPPRLLNAQVDRDLEAICLKCLEKDPAHRYRSARDLADDLDRYLAGGAISARSGQILERLTRALGRGQLDVQFQAWAVILFGWAAVIVVVQIALFVVISIRLPVSAVLATQGSQFLAMGAVYWHHRPQRMLPNNASEQRLWSIWGGFVVSCSLVAAISNYQVGLEKLYDFVLYPYWAALSGFAFLVTGACYWGWAYVLAAAFFALGLIVLLIPAAGPLAFGSLWACSLTVIGMRLRRLGHDG